MLIAIECSGTVNVVRAGPRGAAPIVFLHPVGLDSTWWGAQIEAFVDTHEVIAIDMPGHGLSAAPPGAPTFELLAGVVADVLRKLDTGPARVVGLSVGGMIAQTLALTEPALVQSLALVGTLCSFPAEVRLALHARAHVARTEGMARIAELSNERWFPAAFRERRPDMLDRATRSLLQQPAGFHASMWEMIAGLDTEKALAAIACPTLVVTGALDINAPPSAAEAIVRAIPHASLAVMPGLGHFPPFEAPGAFNDLLRAFLEQQRT